MFELCFAVVFERFEGILTGIFDQRGIQVDGCVLSVSCLVAVAQREGINAPYHYVQPSAVASA